MDTPPGLSAFRELFGDEASGLQGALEKAITAKASGRLE